MGHLKTLFSYWHWQYTPIIEFYNCKIQCCISRLCDHTPVLWKALRIGIACCYRSIKNHSGLESLMHHFMRNSAFGWEFQPHVFVNKHSNSHLYTSNPKTCRAWEVSHRRLISLLLCLHIHWQLLFPHPVI